MVGGRSRKPRPQYCRPGEPAIANHQTHHEVNKELSLRLGASGARNRSPGGYLLKCRSIGRRPRKGIPTKHNPTNQHQGQTSQKHQLPTRRATATSRHSRERPESLGSGPTSLPRGSWNVMPAATWKTDPNYPSNSVLGTIARQLLGWSPSARGWLEPLCGGIGDPFGMFCTGSKRGRTYAVTT